MKGHGVSGGLNQAARTAPLMVLVVLLLVFACVFAARRAPTAQQSREEVCRETEKVLGQLNNELNEAWMLIYVKRDGRTRLSEVRRAIAGGFVVSDFDTLVSGLRFPDPGSSTSERLAAQKTIRNLLEKKIVEVRDTTLEDLMSRADRLEEQRVGRVRRMEDFDCAGLRVEASRPSEGKAVGCYKDSNSPFAMGGPLAYRGPQNTPQRCIEACRGQGYKYAGVQFGESCLCGNTPGDQGSGTCDMPCTGDKTKICGGRYANSVYTTGL